MSLGFAGLLALATAASCAKSSSTADNAKIKELSERVAQLEASQKKLDDVEKFIRPIMAQQQAKMDQEAAREPDPNSRFAVDVGESVFEGPAGAAVTIIEAFDFA